MRRSPGPVLLGLLALSIVLSGCGGDEGSDTERAAESMSGDGMDEQGMDGHDQVSPVAEGARRIEVAATSFEFDPDEITVAAGEDVAIVLSSDDLVHDFTIDAIDVHVAAGRGETEEGGLRADEPGEYTYYCTVAGHRAAGMEGTLVVDDP